MFWDEYTKTYFRITPLKNCQFEPLGWDKWALLLSVFVWTRQCSKVTCCHCGFCLHSFLSSHTQSTNIYWALTTSWIEKEEWCEVKIISPNKEIRQWMASRVASYLLLWKTNLRLDSSGRIFKSQNKCLPWFLTSTDNVSLSITCYVPGANNMKSIPNEQ